METFLHVLWKDHIHFPPINSGEHKTGLKRHKNFLTWHLSYFFVKKKLLREFIHSSSWVERRNAIFMFKKFFCLNIKIAFYVGNISCLFEKYPSSAAIKHVKVNMLVVKSNPGKKSNVSISKIQLKCEQEREHLILWILWKARFQFKRTPSLLPVSWSTRQHCNSFKNPIFILFTLQR